MAFSRDSGTEFAWLLAGCCGFTTLKGIQSALDTNSTLIDVTIRNISQPIQRITSVLLESDETFN